ncbi:hypothetical protein IAQ61_005817 [Plenodomus lingam]|uniref:uncharacterized protein n=1 Tax=Leptosphaeria maculans TaxID=5022 RepID=UPI003334849B|nr:hypothetical protein IAQ61_005817 [Plenodomus lingam]
MHLRKPSTRLSGWLLISPNYNIVVLLAKDARLFCLASLVSSYLLIFYQGITYIKYLCASCPCSRTSDVCRYQETDEHSHLTGCARRNDGLGNAGPSVIVDAECLKPIGESAWVRSDLVWTTAFVPSCGGSSQATMDLKLTSTP